MIATSSVKCATLCKTFSTGLLLNFPRCLATCRVSKNTLPADCIFVVAPAQLDPSKVLPARQPFYWHSGRHFYVLLPQDS
mmetsp:Transcript_18502/g.43303  ORF Transcript_18502/g.43303 Transcript_18502/m.43303 type:complete len:80 (+) Transcript_18502:1806-2045(+)